MTSTCWRPPGARACGKGPGRAAAAAAGACSLVASRAGWRARAAGESGALCRPARLGLASLLLVPAGPKPERGRGMKRTPLPACRIAVGGRAGRPAATRARAALARSGRPGPRTPTFRLAHARRGRGGQTLHTLAGRAPPLNPRSRRPHRHTHAHTPIARPPPDLPSTHPPLPPRPLPRPRPPPGRRHGAHPPPPDRGRQLQDLHRLHQAGDAPPGDPDVRLPRAHGDAVGAGHHQGPPQEGAQGPVHQVAVPEALKRKRAVRFQRRLSGCAGGRRAGVATCAKKHHFF